MILDTIVNGWNLRSLADVVIDVDTIDERREYKSSDVVFCKTDYIYRMFSEVESLPFPIKVITHCSDFEVGEAQFVNRPKCIEKWYAQNVGYQDPDLIPVPIGIENHDGPSKGTFLDFDFMEEKSSSPPPIIEKKNLIYVNLGHTHNNRQVVESLLDKNENCYVRSQRIPFSDYYEEMRGFTMVASPRGNGLDCHRTWEALLVGSIPIVEKNFIYDAWPDLPFIQIDSWASLSYTEQFLPFNAPNSSSLFMPFWADKIKHG